MIPWSPRRGGADSDVSFVPRHNGVRGHPALKTARPRRGRPARIIRADGIVPKRTQPSYLVESTPLKESLDAVVDYLLRDQDFLMSKEVKHRVEELNQLLVRAQEQGLKIEFEIRTTAPASGSRVTHLEVSVYKKI